MVRDPDRGNVRDVPGRAVGQVANGQDLVEHPAGPTTAGRSSRVVRLSVVNVVERGRAFGNAQRAVQDRGDDLPGLTVLLGPLVLRQERTGWQSGFPSGFPLGRARFCRAVLTEALPEQPVFGPYVGEPFGRPGEIGRVGELRPV